MALAFTELKEETFTTNVAIYTSTTTYAPAANSLLIAMVGASAEATAIASTVVTANGATWVAIGDNSRGVDRLYAWYALLGASPTTTTFSVNFGADAATGCWMHVTQVTGHHTTTPIGLVDVATEPAAAATPAATFGGTTASTSGWIAGLISTSSPAALTPPTGGTELMDTGYATPTTGAWVGYHAAQGSLTGLTWGSTTATAGALIAAEIKAAAAAAATSPPPHVFQTHYRNFPLVRR